VHLNAEHFFFCWIWFFLSGKEKSFFCISAQQHGPGKCGLLILKIKWSFRPHIRTHAQHSNRKCAAIHANSYSTPLKIHAAENI
jgi:hypothetical protein